MANINLALSAFYLGALTSFVQKTIKDDAEVGQISDIRISDEGSPHFVFETPRFKHTVSVSVFTEKREDIKHES